MFRLWIGLTQVGLALIALGCGAWAVMALRDKEAECARTMQRTPLIRAAEHAFAFAATGFGKRVSHHDRGFGCIMKLESGSRR